MSILSSERFYGNHLCIDVIEYVDSLDISFFPALSGSEQTTGHRVYVNGGAGDYVYANNANITIDGYSSNTLSVSNHTLVGFKIDLNSGFLRICKKEIPQSGIVSSSSFVDAKNYIIMSPCHVSNLLSSIGDRQMLGFIQQKLINLAARFGIYVPHEYNTQEDQYDGTKSVVCAPALDWLAYPLVREIGSVPFAKNLDHSCRLLLAPQAHTPMNFKALVEYYYGHSTSKMLEEIWKTLTIGSDYRDQVYAEAPQQLIWSNQAGAGLVQPTYQTQRGTRSLQCLVFTLCPAVYKAMGFDYLYQILPQVPHGDTTGIPIRTAMQYDNTAYLEVAIKGLTSFMAPKKVISILVELMDSSKFHFLQDALRMISEFSDVTKIPKTLQGEFPTGLTIDFKFKTLKEMHDKISTQYTIIKSEASKKDIPVHPIYSLLDGREIQGLKLVVPRSTTPLAIWGKLLNICIASYGDKAARGDTLLLGVEKFGEIKYCIEFQSCIIPKIASIEPQVIDPNTVMYPKEAAIERLPLPRLVMKHVGVMPTDVPDEESYYAEPKIYQFRSDRNGVPDKNDEAIVMNMLVNWTRENIKELQEIKALFEANGDYSYTVQYEAQPDRLIMNRQQYNALQNLLVEGNVVDPGPPPANHINVIPNVNVNPDQVLIVDAVGRVEVGIENIELNIPDVRDVRVENNVDGPD